MNKDAQIQQRIDRERLCGPDRISSTPAVRRGGSGGDTMELFLLTSVAASPMTGTHKTWGGSSWGNGTLGSGISIYPHPASAIDNYQTDYVWAVKKVETWFAVDMSNVPDSICEEE